jgi:hypothetical protein
MDTRGKINVKLIIRLDTGTSFNTEQWWMGIDAGANWQQFLHFREHEIRDIIFGLQGGISGIGMYGPTPRPPLYFHSYFLDGFHNQVKSGEKLSPSYILQDGMTISVIYRQSNMMSCLNGPYGKKLKKNWVIKQSPDFLMHHRWVMHRILTTQNHDDPYSSDEYSSDEEASEDEPTQSNEQDTDNINNDVSTNYVTLERQ